MMTKPLNYFSPITENITHYLTLFYFPSDFADQRRKKFLLYLRTSAKPAGDKNELV